MRKSIDEILEELEKTCFQVNKKVTEKQEYLKKNHKHRRKIQFFQEFEKALKNDSSKNI